MDRNTGPNKSGQINTHMSEHFRAIGAALRDAREAKGLTYAQVADDCKVQEKYLRAVEEGHSDTLPVQVYFPLFSRAFAQAVGLNPEQLSGRFYLEPAPGAENGDDKSPLPIAVPAPYNSRLDRLSHPSLPSGQEPRVRWVDRGRAGLALKVAVFALVAGAIYTIVRYGVMSDGYADEPARSTSTDTVAGPAPLGAFDAPRYRPQEKLKLTLKATDSAWVTLTADGDTIFNRDLRTGEAVTLLADYRFRINGQDLQKIELYIDGQRLKPLRANRGEEFEINQLNFRDLLLHAPLEANTTP